jgi:hypothetical protein
VAQLYPWALGSLYVVFYDSQGYGGGILTLPLLGGKGACIYSLQPILLAPLCMTNVGPHRKHRSCIS